VPARALASSPEQATVATVQSLLLRAQDWWSSNASTILNEFQTGNAAGQCTAYAAARRPDFIERVNTRAYVSFVISKSTGPLVLDWVARDWAFDAWWSGMPIGKKPRPDAIVVFQPGAYGASPVGGHVAVVDHVRRDGSFTISEMHAPKLGVISTRRFGRRIARAMAKDPRVTFIYR
jgi:surface antigen